MTGSAAAQQQPLSLGTGAKGGTFYEYGPGLAEMVAERGGPAVAPLTTGGSNENLKLLEAGQLDLGLIALGPAWEAWNAAEPWVGAGKMRKIRALLPMYETPFHIAALKESGIASLRQLAGRRVGAGPAKGPAENIFRGLLEATAIRVEIVSGSPSDLAAMVADRRIDAFFFGGGLPVTAFEEIARAAPMTVFGLDESEAAAHRRRFPYLAPATVPAGTYKGQDRPIATVALWNFVLARADLPDDAAYALVESVLGDPARAARIHPAASATLARNAVADDFLPFHPGALRWYREAGVTLAVK